jgi:alpha-glucan phosphorylase-like protein
VQNNFAQIPIEIVQLETGEKVQIAINFPGRTVKAQVWRARVGRIALYFLDTDLDENASKDREITDKLYDAETRERVEQEILLGIGGVQLLRELNIDASVFHLNEGHSAFLLIERIICLMKDHGLDFDTAREAVRSSTVFTTHTPVPAGNERFDRSLIENYLRTYIQSAGLEWDQFWNLGHVYGGDDGPST